MARIKIETITPVHIGSGRTLQYGNDFVTGKMDDGDNAIGIIDPDMVLELIGHENIHKWVNMIDKRIPTNEILKGINNKNYGIEDYCSRILLRKECTVLKTDTLKEHIHNGEGKPYIPGSSIKGAIRTAVMSVIANKTLNLREIDNSNRPLGKNFERHFFGGNPNSDVFRFLQVGDAYFGENYVHCLRLVKVNEKRNNNYADTSRSSLIEALSEDDESEFTIQLKKDVYHLAEHQVSPLPQELESLSKLFQTINKHTIEILQGEVEHWMRKSDEETSGIVDSYLKRVNTLITKANKCASGQECILRIGHGSGWRFITGAWTEMFDDFDEIIPPIARPNNVRYQDYTFPKSRRVDEKVRLLGFVKLSLLDQ